MSVEKDARQALRRLIFWRLVGGLVVLPRLPFLWASMLLSQVAEMFMTVYRVGRDVELTVFCAELAAARRYKLLTGFDFGLGTGDQNRYASLDDSLRDKAAVMLYRGMTGEEPEDES